MTSGDAEGDDDDNTSPPIKSTSFELKKRMKKQWRWNGTQTHQHTHLAIEMKIWILYECDEQVTVIQELNFTTNIRNWSGLLFAREPELTVTVTVIDTQPNSNFSVFNVLAFIFHPFFVVFILDKTHLPLMNIKILHKFSTLNFACIIKLMQHFHNLLMIFNIKHIFRASTRTIFPCSAKFWCLGCCCRWFQRCCCFFSSFFPSSPFTTVFVVVVVANEYHLLFFAFGWCVALCLLATFIVTRWILIWTLQIGEYTVQTCHNNNTQV